jgi:hypothetical protein
MPGDPGCKGHDKLLEESPMMESFSQDDPAAADRFRKMFGPAQIDQEIRQAIHFCWMLLPEDQRSADEVERQIRRIVDRALKDFRDDSQAFGIGRG